MVFRLFRYALFLAAAPLFAAAINVSGLTEVTLHHGDALSFAINAASYGAHAAHYGAPEDPSAISFSLISLPAGEDWSFSAEIQAKDGSASAAFSDLFVGAAEVQEEKYRGPVTSIHGSLDLSPDVSRSIFSGPGASLTLRNTGGDVTLGLSPYKLPQDLLVTVSGGALQVGAVVARASLEESAEGDAAPYTLGRAGQSAGSGAPESVPEPSPASLLVCGALFWALARLTTRGGRGRAQQ
jgi:hypothetical protein